MVLVMDASISKGLVSLAQYRFYWLTPDDLIHEFTALAWQFIELDLSVNSEELCKSESSAFTLVLGPRPNSGSTYIALFSM